MGLGMGGTSDDTGTGGGGNEGPGLASSIASFFGNISAPDFSKFSVNPVVQQPQIAPMETRGSTQTGNAPASNVATGPFGVTYGQTTSQPFQGSPISVAPPQTAQAPMTMPELSPVSPYVSTPQIATPAPAPAAPSLAQATTSVTAPTVVTDNLAAQISAINNQLSYGPGVQIGTSPGQFGVPTSLGPEIEVASLPVAPPQSPQYGQPVDLGAPIDVASLNVFDAYQNQTAPDYTSIDAEIGQDTSTPTGTPSTSPSSNEDLVAGVSNTGGGGTESPLRPFQSTGTPQSDAVTQMANILYATNPAFADQMNNAFGTPASQAAASATQNLALNTSALSNLANFVSTQNVAVTPGVTPYVGLPAAAATGAPASTPVPDFGAVSYPTGSTSSGSSGSGTA